MSSNLEKLTQQAVINWLNNNAVHGVTIGVSPRHFETDNTNPVALPTIIVRSTREAEEIIGSGVWRMKVEVSLISQADTTTDAVLDSHWSNLMDVLNWDELAARMSDLDGFHCYGAIDTAASDKTVVERHWSFRFEFVAFCMTMDLTPQSSSSSGSSESSESSSSSSSRSSQSSQSTDSSSSSSRSSASSLSSLSSNSSSSSSSRSSLSSASSLSSLSSNSSSSSSSHSSQSSQSSGPQDALRFNGFNNYGIT